VGGKSLLEYDQVKERLVRIQSWFTSCAAMCRYTSENAPITRILQPQIPAKCHQIRSHGYDAGCGPVFPATCRGKRVSNWTIWQDVASLTAGHSKFSKGSNDILYQQITESVIKKMRKSGITSLYSYLKSYELTSRASEYLREATDFTLQEALSQRKQVLLGKTLGYILTMNMVIQLGERGFQSQLIHNALEVLSADVKSMLSAMKQATGTEPEEAIGPEADWFAYI
jgi:hypothetical protein